MSFNIPKTSIADESSDVIRVPSTSVDSPRIFSEEFYHSKRSRTDLTPEPQRKRQRTAEISPTMSIDSDNSSTISVASTLDSFTGFVSGSRALTIKTYMRVATDVDAYRRLVKAGDATSSKVASEFQRIFREYATKIHQRDWGRKLRREQRRVEKRIRLRSYKIKRKHRRQMRELRQRETAQTFSVIVGDFFESGAQQSKLKNPQQRGTFVFDQSERQRLNAVDANIAKYEKYLDALLELKYRPLTSSENKIIARTMSLPASNIIQTRFGINMKVSLLQCLTPGVWLNDEVINFWLGMIQDRSNFRAGSCKYPSNYQTRVFIMNTFFWTKLYNQGTYTYKNVKRWTKKSKLKRVGVNSIFELDKFLFPVHVNKTHWCAGVVNLKRKRFEYYDSLGGCHDNFFKFCRHYLLDERAKVGVDFPLDGFENYCPQNVPHQTNGSDCGVFTLKFLEWACECRDPREKGGFSQENMHYFRQRTLLEIIQGKLLET